MHNPIGRLFSQYGQKRKPNILILSHDEKWESALCKLNINLYRIKLGNAGWDEQYERPENHYILPENTIEPQINYDVLIIPNHKYPQQLVQQISQSVQIPTIQVNDIGLEKLPDESWIENIDPSTDKFTEEWDKKLTQIKGKI